MPQTTSVIASRRQSLVGEERPIGEPTQMEAPSLQPPPTAARARAAAFGATISTRREETVIINRGEAQISVSANKPTAAEVEDELIGPVEDDVPLPPKGIAAKFSVLKNLKIGQSRWIKRKSGLAICSLMAKETGFKFVWAAEKRMIGNEEHEGCRIWRVQPK